MTRLRQAVRPVVTFGVIGTVLVMEFLGKTPSADLWTMAKLIAGFWFVERAVTRLQEKAS